jgi:hypothetical protein
VADQIAKIVEATWSKDGRSEMKEIYDNIKRPQNTPSLQTVDLNYEILSQLNTNRKDTRGTKIRKMDYQLRAVNKAVVMAGINITRLADSAATAQPTDDIRQMVTDTAFETLQVLAHAASLIHPIRRHNCKPRLAANMRHQLCKSSLPETNSSHLLFGNDLHKQAKEGTD